MPDEATNEAFEGMPEAHRRVRVKITGSSEIFRDEMPEVGAKVEIGLIGTIRVEGEEQTQEEGTRDFLTIRLDELSDFRVVG